MGSTRLLNKDDGLPSWTDGALPFQLPHLIRHVYALAYCDMHYLYTNTKLGGCGKQHCGASCSNTIHRAFK